MSFDITYHLSRKKLSDEEEAEALICIKFQGFVPAIGDEVYFPAHEAGFHELQKFANVQFTVYRRFALHLSDGIESIIVYASAA